MYASVTDYAAIYNDAYRLRRGAHTSFDRTVLPPLIAEYCHQIGCSRLLDVSGGQGGLGRELQMHGIESVTTDFGSLEGSGVITFNLSEFEQSQHDCVLRAINPERGAYLTTCFDVLEHIDREHVAGAVYNLANLTDEFLVVSISTRPSAFDNLLHATLMPISTWIKAFEAAGLQLAQKNAFPTATTRWSFPRSDEMRLINQWMTADIFSDVEAGEPIYLIFKKNKGTAPATGIMSAVDVIVDVAYRKTKRAQFGLAENRRFNFNIHHHQEWAVIRPLLDVIPRQQCRFLIRPDNIVPDILRAIRSFLARTGVKVVEYSDVSELPWLDLKGEILISGAESSLGMGHLLSHEMVAIARLHGCQTFLLQHGVWPRSFEHRVVTFASEHVLTWGRADEGRLNDRKHKIFGADVPWGVFPSDQAFPIGAPKFSDQLLGPFPGLDTKFGIDDSRFDRTVLIGTKNLRGRWGIHNVSDQFLGELDSLVSRNDKTLFIVRPHPTDSAESFANIRHPNVKIFDELVGILSDTPLSRVLPYVDIVATSPSSLTIDAAVSGKPIFVYDTGQPIEFDNMQVAPFEKLQHVIDTSNDIGRLNEFSHELKSLYAESVDDRFYSKFSKLLSSRWHPKIDSFIAASASLASQAVNSARAKVAIEATSAALVAEEAKLAQRVAQLSEELKSTSARLAQLSLENAAITNSSSWRITKPLRKIVEALRTKNT